MNACKTIAAAAAAAVLVATPCRAADAQHGFDLAQRWCASCHLITPGQNSGSADVPPFATIANTPHFNATALAYFLLDPHPKMPDLGLSRTAADDIAAYIGSLKQ